MKRKTHINRLIAIVLAIALSVSVVVFSPGYADAKTASSELSLSGSAHIQSKGNTAGTWDGTTLTLGTTGESKRLEAITLNLANNTGYSGTIQYRVYRQTYGWTSWVESGTEAGTTGQSKRIEAVQIKLTGDLAEHYSVRYRVHIQTYGWAQGWQYDGATAGTLGEAKRLEELEVELVAKGTVAMGVSYRVHRQTYGWESIWKTDGMISGTTGESKRLEGITITLTGNEYSGGIEYITHVQSYGWEWDYRTNGVVAGTSGESKRLEAIKIQLTGEVADYYDVYYRVHAQSFGWLGWAKNGESAGTASLSKRLEAIQIILVKKGESAPGSIYGVTSTKTSAFYETASTDTASASTTQHQHNYNQVIWKTVHHDAETHTEEQTVTETKYYSAIKCSCGKVFDAYEYPGYGALEAAMDKHQKEACVADYTGEYLKCGSWGNISDVGHEVQTTKTVTVTDKEAYDEKIIAGYQCECGAVQ